MSDFIEDFDRSKLLNVSVHLTAIREDQIHHYSAYNCNVDDDDKYPLSMVPVECCICLDDVAHDPHIKCLECTNFETILCLKCFKMGAESGEHRRGHNYEIVDKVGPNLFDNIPDKESWGCYEDLAMLSSFLNGRLLQWWEVDEPLQISRQRTVQEALNRLDRCFLRSQIGDYILDEVLQREPIHFARDDTFEGVASEAPTTAQSSCDDSFERQLALFHNPFLDGFDATLKDETPTDSTLPQNGFATPQISPAYAKKSSARGGGKSPKLKPQEAPLSSSAKPGSSRMSATPSPSERPVKPHKQHVTRQTSRNSLQQQATADGPEKKECEDSDSDSSFPWKAKKRSKMELPRRGSEARTEESQKDNESGMCSPSPVKRRPSTEKRSRQRRHMASDEDGQGDSAMDATDFYEANDDDDVVMAEESAMNDSDEDGVAERIMSRRTSAEFRANRREILENAKIVASEAMRRSLSTRMRKSSLELSEALNADEATTSRLLHKSSDIMSEERLLELRLKYPDSYFISHPPRHMSREAMAKYDPDDLQIIGYMPMRDDYEHEYKHKAENLINQIVFRRPIEDPSKSDVEKFSDVVKLACIQRYNRVLKSRTAKHGAIVEHDLINEFLQIAKNNASEKGKYNVFDEKYFNSKRKEEDYRPLFCKLRQVADRPTVNMLARNIGRMDTLMDQIEELKQLQQSGVKTLKGKLKVDTVPPCWSKKRRSRKTDNIEIKKANARWKRIIRWSKRQPDVEESYDEKAEMDVDEAD